MNNHTKRTRVLLLLTTMSGSASAETPAPAPRTEAMGVLEVALRAEHDAFAGQLAEERGGP